MTYYFKCVLCGAEYDPRTVRYVCPKHGDDGILDTVFDFTEISKTASPHTIADSPDFSIWRYAPLLPLDNPQRSAPPLQVGWTPLYRSTTLGVQLGINKLYFKDDGRNPTSSLKDRASAVVVAKARELGIELITTASTGNAGAALAGLAAAAKMPAVIFVPKTAPQAKIAQLLIYGARVILVEGNYDKAFELCLQVTKEFGWYCRSTAFNPYTVEGKKTAALEICEQLQWKSPDVVFASVGDGNIICGLWKGFRDLLSLGWIEKMPRLIGIQAETSAACYNAWKAGNEKIVPVQATTIADSISADFPRDGVRAVRAVRETGGVYLTVTDPEILNAIPELARGEGIFCEPAASAAYAGLKKAVQQGVVRADDNVVCLLTGNGLKDISSAMKVAGTPTVIEPTLEAVRRLNISR